jgi:Trypsin-co-occurring domain 1
MADPQTTIPLSLPNGVVIRAEATALAPLDRERPVVMRHVVEPQEFAGLMRAVEGIASGVADTMTKLRPTEASVEFGLEMGMESGKLTALLVKGSAKGNLKITLTWTRADAGDLPEPEPGG